MPKQSCVVCSITVMIGMMMGATFAQAQGEGVQGTYSLAFDARESLGNTLRMAAREGRGQDVLKILNRGADINSSGQFGETALMMAAKLNRVNVVELLIRNGADLNARDAEGETALIKGSKSCASYVTSQLVDAGALVNVASYSGATALIFAARENCVHVVAQLTHVKGVDVMARDESDRNALDYALVEAQIEVGGPASDVATALLRTGTKPTEYRQMPYDLTSARKTPVDPRPVTQAISSAAPVAPPHTPSAANHLP